MKASAAICLAVLFVPTVIGPAPVFAESKKDDADLRPARLNIPDVENAFTYFKLAARKAYRPDDKAETYDAMFAGEAWNKKLAARIIKKNQKAFEHLRQGLEQARMEPPEASGLDALIPVYAGWRKLARLKTIHAAALQRRGEHKKALDQAMSAVKFGHMIESGRGPILQYLVGLSVKETALSSLRARLADANLKRQQLKDYLEGLAAYVTDPDALADSLRAEYAFGLKLMDDLYPHRAGDSEKETPKHDSVFQSDKMRTMYADTLRTYIGNAAKPRCDHVEPQLVDKGADKAFEKMPPAELASRPDAMGMMVCMTLIPPLDKLLMEKCRENVSVAATRILIALKCHKMKTGKLPGTLDALVPDYIDKIPSDDFDGKPMRYSPKKKLIYSVGEDMKDDGGDAERDLIYEIGF